MASKSTVMVGMVVGSSIGGYLPVLLGASFLSLWTVVGSLVGGIVGIWLVVKLGES